MAQIVALLHIAVLHTDVLQDVCSLRFPFRDSVGQPGGLTTLAFGWPNFWGSNALFDSQTLRL